MIQRCFYDILTIKAKKEFTTKSEFCMSVYYQWIEKGFVSDSQMKYLEKGFNGNSKNRSYYRIIKDT